MLPGHAAECQPLWHGHEARPRLSRSAGNAASSGGMVIHRHRSQGLRVYDPGLEGLALIAQGWRPCLESAHWRGHQKQCMSSRDRRLKGQTTIEAQPEGKRVLLTAHQPPAARPGAGCCACRRACCGCHLRAMQLAHTCKHCRHRSTCSTSLPAAGWLQSNGLSLVTCSMATLTRDLRGRLLCSQQGWLPQPSR